MINVLIADDQRLLRESLKKIIENDGEIKVTGCASNGQEAFEMCRGTPPDVVLMDLKMPDCDGVEGTRLIKENYSSVKVIILTTFDDHDNISNALGMGADGYILKDIVPEELIMVIKNACLGFHIMSAKTYGVLSGRREKTLGGGKADEGKSASRPLNDTEQQILQLVAEGKNNREIAADVFLSEGRVKNIISEMYLKMKLKDRYQMISYAYKNNLIK